MKKTFELNILNQKFTFKSDNDEKQVKKVSDYVNKKMHEIVSSNKAISTSNIAILAALNIADDFFRMKVVEDDFLGRSIDKLKGLLKRLEE